MSKLESTIKRMQNKVIDFRCQIVGINAFGTSFISLISAVLVEGTKLEYIAGISMAGGRYLIRPYDSTAIKKVEKACLAAGFNASIFSKELVQVTVSSMTREDKVEMMRRIKQMGECFKITIRGIRKRFRQTCDSLDKEIQKATDEAIAKIDNIIAEKQKILL